ncbi:MAG TPA: lactate racemase domain-containing protein [Frankiaceae bacterium]|nr:lactate racemase domain-containing protein [Frankiaceae bacterium]
MTRPGFVLEVDERTPPLLVHSGETLRLERFPLGTRVIYPPEILPGIEDEAAAIDAALDSPIDSPPLRELLRPGMKLTIAFDDISLPLPPMRLPDIRQRLIEAVLTRAAEAGVDDVELIVANALHRRMTAAEIRRAVGERVFLSFWPDRLTNHDAEDPGNLLHVGLTNAGEDVEINKRAAESDLLVYVNVNLVAMDGGHKSVPIGLASYKSLRHHHNSHTMVHSRSFMDPEKSALHSSAWRMGRLLSQSLSIFQIETTLNNQAFPQSMGFLTKREWEWSARDQAMAFASVRGLDRVPARLRRRSFQRMEADYGLTSVQAGEVEAVHKRTLESVHRQQLVEVNGQSDVLVLGLPFVGPYNVNSVMNPILAMCLGLGYFFNMYRGQPLVRPGGALIIHHPVPYEFSQLHHPSYVDFFEEVLVESTDPATIEAKFEKAYATDPWYIHLYRTSHAYHGVHPFYMWYWGAHALDHLGDSRNVVWVGADRKAVERMGFRAATTMADALEMVHSAVGSSPTISYLHAPPHTLADVR